MNLVLRPPLARACVRTGFEPFFATRQNPNAGPTLPTRGGGLERHPYPLIVDAWQLPHSGTVDDMWKQMQEVIPSVHTASFGH